MGKAARALPPPPPPASILSLPTDVLRLVVAHLSTHRALAALGSTCAELNGRVSQCDDAYAPFLLSEARRIAAALRSRPRAAQSCEEDAALLQTALWLVARAERATGCTHDGSSSHGGCRRGLALLQTRTCALCGRAGTSGCWLPLTRRGLCVGCTANHVSATERWRRAALPLEEAARRRLDQRRRATILAAVGAALPPYLRRASPPVAAASATGARRTAATGDGEPSLADTECDAGAEATLELLFDSSRHGGSSAALLRAADDAPATLLVISSQPRAGGVEQDGKREGDDEEGEREGDGEESEREGGESPGVAASATSDDGSASDDGRREMGAAAGDAAEAAAFPSADGCEWPERSAPTPSFFGAFIHGRWSQRSETGFFGDASCFLFCSPPAARGGAAAVGAEAPEAFCAQIMRPTGHNANYAHASAAHGIGFGGTLGAFALALDSDLTSGRCLPSLTYRDTACVAPTHFLCDTVQLWALRGLHETPNRRSRRHAAWERADGSGALEPGENKMMLEVRVAGRGRNHAGVCHACSPADAKS